MKTSIYLIIASIYISIGLKAQEQQKRFFFKNFQNTYVYYKDGRNFCIPANYDLVKGSFIFIDKQDRDMLKLFDEQDKISKIKAPKRCIIRFKPLFPAAVCPNAAARAAPGGLVVCVTLLPEPPFSFVLSR